MASFSRTIKSPSYLSPVRRPSMPGRSFSNSSDRSLTTNEDGIDRPNTSSGRTTPQAPQPYHQACQARRCFGSTTGATSPGDSASSALARSGEPPATSSQLSKPSSPMTIELPHRTRHSSSSVATPPEPLSARGDLPGGYFPNHEDPRLRVQRTHPFQNDKKSNFINPIPEIEVSASARDRRDTRRQHPSAAMGTANVPVASYFPTGYHDNPLPMGKYYPSNYERTNGQSRPTSATPSSPADARSPGFSGPTSPSQPSAATEPDVRRKMQLQQYKRDMMAQVSRAASEVMGASSPSAKGSPKMGPSAAAGLKGYAGIDVRLGGTSLHKPNAPRLHPLGSPGPVTPMELESSSSFTPGADGGSYLDKGAGFPRLSPGLAPPSKELTPQTS